MRKEAPTRISVVTNACSLDADRLQMVVPHWLRIFQDVLGELLIVVDPSPPSGRIAALHGSEGSLATVREVLADLKRLDGRIRVVELPTGNGLAKMLSKWFRSGQPIRCRAGTPIAAFIASIDLASHDIVLRADCDMLFHQNGWVAQGISKLTTGDLDMIEPSNLASAPGDPVSTRAAMLNLRRIERRILPMVPHRVHGFRRLKTLLEGNPPWLALEQMWEKERQSGRLRFQRFSVDTGCSLHVAKRDEAQLAIIPRVVECMEAGTIPQRQLARGGNFDAAAWQS